tara:strand:+ start:3088 stop:4101 length:1014 start_codon:yes stop_codon:yes gene_type:complete
MNKIILTTLVLFTSIIYAQDVNNSNKAIKDLEFENKKLIDENKDLELKIDSLEKEVSSIKNKLDLKADNKKFDIEIDSIKSNQKKIINKIKEKANIVSVESIKNSLENKIDATKSNINDNTTQLGSAKDEIKNILVTLDDQGINIQNTSGKVEKNNIYILLSFLLGIMLLITCIIIYRLTSKNKTNISSANDQLKRIKELDDDLKNILEKHTKILENDNGTDSQEETLKSLKIVADEIMTMENNIYQMTEDEQNSRGLKRIKRAIKNLRNNYKTMGYDIPVLLGIEWKEGDIIEIISEIPDENIEKGKRIISRVVTPRIDFKGKMIQRAKVELKSNI